jgi:2-oxoglutarate dehydrogenase E2 component (dihydrolipoamide succinyltransferase)
MLVDVIMPKIAESIFEGTLVKWLKKPGDSVKQDEPLFEISTDKVDTEIPAPSSGVLQDIVVNEGATVPINTVVGHIETEVGAAKPAPAKPAEPPAARPAPTNGGPAETPKVSVTAGKSEEEESEEEGGRVFASPLVRQMAKAEGIDLSKIQGTGFKGRITKQDVEQFIQKQRGAQTAATKIETAPKPAQAPAVKTTPQEIKTETGGGAAVSFPLVITGPTETVPMTNMRKKIAEHMVASKRISPHVATVFEIDCSRITEVRDKEKDYYETVYGLKLTFTAFFAQAAVNALKEFPIMNCSVDGDKIIYKKYINLGIAVALPDGLIVPVIRGADEKSFLGLARSINDIAERARAKKLSIDDIQGGTFTITNPGIYGGMFGIPVINQPQVAIMGCGGIEKRPVVVNDAIAIRPMMYMSCSFDHRVIDGAVADQFMVHVKKTLQNWDIPVK